MKNESANRTVPLNTELVEFSRHLLNIGGPTGAQEFNLARTAAMLGFMVLLRAVELSAFEVKDSPFWEY